MNTSTSFCDGLARRDLLRVGCAGLFGAGLGLSELLAREAAAGSVAPRDGVSIIILFLKGGMSTIDTFDLKPLPAVRVKGKSAEVDVYALS